MPSCKPFSETENVRTDSFHLDDDDSTILRVYAEHGYFGGEIKDNKPNVIEPLPLWVDPDYRGNGIGECLVKQLAEVAKKRNVDTIRGHIESQYALDLRGHIFGRESMKFFHDKPSGGQEEVPEQYQELPITFEQARESLARAEEHENSPNDRSIGFIVEQALKDFKP